MFFLANWRFLPGNLVNTGFLLISLLIKALLFDSEGYLYSSFVHSLGVGSWCYLIFNYLPVKLNHCDNETLQPHPVVVTWLINELWLWNDLSSIMGLMFSLSLSFSQRFLLLSFSLSPFLSFIFLSVCVHFYPACSSSYHSFLPVKDLAKSCYIQL